MMLFCTLSNTSFLLGAIIVVDWLTGSLALAQVASEILLLLLVVVTQQLLPVVGIDALLLLDHLPLHLLLLHTTKRSARAQTSARKRYLGAICRHVTSPRRLRP